MVEEVTSSGNQPSVGGEPLAQVLITVRNILLAIGLILIFFFGIQFFRVDQIIEAQPVPVFEDGSRPTVEEIRANREMGKKIFRSYAVTHAALGFIFLVGAFFLPVAPPVIVTILAVAFLGLQIGFMVWEPTIILIGMVFKILVMVGLFYCTRKILEAETGQRAF